MKKKLISLLLLSFVWVFALCACGSRQAEVEQTPAVPVETTAPTPEPTESPMSVSTPAPTLEPTTEPTLEPTPEPAVEPTAEPISEPTIAPSKGPIVAPKPAPSEVLAPKENTEPVTSAAVDQTPETDPAVQESRGVISGDVTGQTSDDTGEIPYTFDESLFAEGFDPNDLSKSPVTLNPVINYWDFDGHLKAYNDGMDYQYREWCEKNMDWVNQYIASHVGCTLEKYLECNCKYDKD